MKNAIENPGLSETLLLNLAIIPPDPVASVAHDLSSQALPKGGIFCLDGVTRFAHMTLYMARFHQHQVTTLIAESNRLVYRIRRQFIQHVGYFVTAGRYYEVSYARTPDLLAMHEVVAHLLAPFRYSPGRPHREKYFGAYSKEQQVNAREWGYDLVGSLYRPHITITRFSESTNKGPKLPKASNSLSFMASQIGLFEADDLGAARRLITTIELVG
jgi:hypothetical protein